MNYKITKHRKGIVKLLDRVFVIMKQNEDVLHEIEEDWAKGNFKRNLGFEQDDQYSRDFFRLNLKYNFFINPNLTDAELQIITNDARSRIVRLYAESYKYFLTGFQILQELQETLGLEVLTETTKKSKKETENLMSKTKIKNKSKTINNDDKSNRFDPWKLRILPEHREFSDEIYSEIKEGNIAKKYRDIYMNLYNIANTTNDENTRSVMTNSLKTLNAYMVNILKSKQSDINDEIKNNILAEMDKYNPTKIDNKNISSSSSNQEVLQTNIY